MQLRVLLSSMFITLCATSAQAQIKVLPAHPVAKSDSTKNKLTAKTGASLLASNAPRNTEKPGYTHVPLAGEKSYFGEKNEYVTDFVRKYMESHSRTLSSVQSNSASPFSIIDNILEQKNMPKELKYLAVIESALNNNAVSHAGAVGPWQMMETTARMMGLTVNRKTDERKDLNKSTAAATKYLEYLYSQLNDWLLVVAAYNSGPTPVVRAIEKTGSNNFWDIKDQLPRETQGHVLAFIATASIFENLSKFISLGSIPLDFNFTKEKEEEPALKESALKAIGAAPAPVATAAPTISPIVKRQPVFTEDELKNMVILKVDKPITFDVMARELGVEASMMKRWNPDYEQFEYSKTPTTFKLRLPKDKTDVFLQKKDGMIKKSEAFYKTAK